MDLRPRDYFLVCLGGQSSTNDQTLPGVSRSRAGVRASRTRCAPRGWNIPESPRSSTPGGYTQVPCLSTELAGRDGRVVARGSNGWGRTGTLASAPGKQRLRSSSATPMRPSLGTPRVERGAKEGAGHATPTRTSGPAHRQGAWLRSRRGPSRPPPLNASRTCTLYTCGATASAGGAGGRPRG